MMWQSITIKAIRKKAVLDSVIKEISEDVVLKLRPL